jgi:hypothetical protein
VEQISWNPQEVNLDFDIGGTTKVLIGNNVNGTSAGMAITGGGLFVTGNAAVTGSLSVASCTGCGSATFTTNSTLSGNGTVSTPLGINLANANTWSGAQTLSGGATASTLNVTGATSLSSTVSVGSTLTSYDGAPTAGIGQPVVYESLNDTNIGAGGSGYFTCGGGTCPAGIYRIGGYAVTTTAGTAGTVSFSVTWNDGTATHTAPLGSISATSLGSYDSLSNLVILTNGTSTSMEWIVTAAGLAGSPKWTNAFVLERIQ